MFKRIRDLREDHDYLQSDIANILSISAPQYGLYERGDREIPIHKLIILANYYNVSIDYILGRTDCKSLMPIEVMNSQCKKLINYYSKLSTVKKDLLIGKAAELYDSQQKEIQD